MNDVNYFKKCVTLFFIRLPIFAFRYLIILTKMKKDKNDHHGHHSDSKTYKLSAGQNGGNANKAADNPLLEKPEKSIPVKQDLDNRRSIKNRPHQH